MKSSLKMVAKNIDKIRWFGISRVVGIAVSVVAVALAGWWLVRVPPPPPEANLPFASTTVVANRTDVESATAAKTAQVITVHVAGAVKTPGVYRLRLGSRVVDGIAAAGGATSAANLDVINLATVLNEGEQLYVPKRGEKPHTIIGRPQSGSSTTTGGAGNAKQVININLASVVELEQLPGVGPATAKAIVAYREKNGAFRAVEDLLKVRGIGPAKLREILPRARVD